VDEQTVLGSGAFAIYDCGEKRFTLSPALRERLAAPGGSLTEEERLRLENILSVMSGLSEPSAYQARFHCLDREGHPLSCQVDFVCDQPHRQIVLAPQDETSFSPTAPVCQIQNHLTGLMTREAFLGKLETIGSAQGAIVYFDIQRFKVINAMFGMIEGDRLLRHVASHLLSGLRGRGFACQLSADRFAFWLAGGREETERFIDSLFDEISAFGLPFEIMCNAGVCLLEDRAPSAAALDEAIMAQSAVKGSFAQRYHYYTDELRASLLSEHEITGMMRQALQSRQFSVYYQPQYNHSTGMLVGAEALVRWLHPEKGLISPAQFIPVFENNGFISQVDRYVFEEVCVFLRERLDKSLPVVPVSVNLSRYDLFTHGFLEGLEEIRRRHDVPVKYVRVEITESSALGNSRFINEALAILHKYGYVVEMDDFGSGYSSLNILKDVSFDVIKLDMNFFRKGEDDAGRGGTILSSMVRMVNWLQLSLIAEGVEQMEQADFLRSIGCDLIQGYLYSKPLPAGEFDKLLQGSRLGSAAPQMSLIETMDAERFWSSDSLETLIFSNYVGGAAIFDYDRKRGTAELLRVNKKYLQELGMNLTEKDLICRDPMDGLDESGKTSYMDMLDNAIRTGDEHECETWRAISSSCCGDDKICIRSSVRVVGHSREHYIFYAMIRNVTREKRRWTDLLDNERRFKAASEQINIYYWEYTVATHEMRPCFRCMRDLGFPALMTNYPESAIAMGVFPPEVADEYREWMRKIDSGEAKSLDGIIPLTVGRVPFHVRYTTEFDENGRPIKAYGSAALVVD